MLSLCATVSHLWEFGVSSTFREITWSQTYRAKLVSVGSENCFKVFISFLKEGMYTSIRMAKAKLETTPNASKDAEKLDHSYTADKNVRQVQPLWKTV